MAPPEAVTDKNNVAARIGVVPAGMKDNDCRHIGDSSIQAYNVGCMKAWMDYEPRSLQEILK